MPRPRIGGRAEVQPGGEPFATLSTPMPRPRPWDGTPRPRAATAPVSDLGGSGGHTELSDRGYAQRHRERRVRQPRRRGGNAAPCGAVTVTGVHRPGRLTVN